MTPLLMTIWKGSLHLAAILLQAGANPDIPDSVFIYIYLLIVFSFFFHFFFLFNIFILMELFYIYFFCEVIYRVPLLFAIKRCDTRAVRLLLDFGADPNCSAPENKKGTDETQQLSLLTVAAKFGFYKAIEMLRKHGAKIDNGSESPILAAIRSGNRECLAALIKDDEQILLSEIHGKSIIYHSIQMNTTLLPLIAAIANQEYEKLLRKETLGNKEFPPSDVKGRDLKKLQKALNLKDTFLPYETIQKEAEELQSPWHVVDHPFDINSPLQADLEKSHSFLPPLQESESPTQLSDNFRSSRKLTEKKMSQARIVKTEGPRQIINMTQKQLDDLDDSTISINLANDQWNEKKDKLPNKPKPIVIKAGSPINKMILMLPSSSSSSSSSTLEENKDNASETPKKTLSQASPRESNSSYSCASAKAPTGASISQQPKAQSTKLTISSDEDSNPQIEYSYSDDDKNKTTQGAVNDDINNEEYYEAYEYEDSEPIPERKAMLQ